MITPYKLSETVTKNLSERLRDEQNANRFYRYAANCLGNSGYMIAAKYYKAEAAAEVEHSLGLQDYAVDWNVELDFLELPAIGEIEGIVEIVNTSYGLEYDLLEAYKKDRKAALDEGDQSTFDFLQKYVQIQTESVAEYATMLNMLQLFKIDNTNLFLFEDKLCEK